MVKTNVPFDQFSRYQDLRTIILLCSEQESLENTKILDVGGFFLPTEGKAYLPVADFFPEAEIVCIDRTESPNPLAGYCLADGLSLPFADDAFDWVNASDVIEHIPVDKRAEFIKEMLRCSRGYISLSAPRGAPEVELAEELVVAYIKRIMGIDHEALNEHRQFGIPRESDVINLVQAVNSSLSMEILPSGNLFRWIFLMVSRHLFISLSPTDEGLNPEIDRLYNSFLYESDHSSPTYRSIYVISEKDISGLGKRFLGQFDMQEKQGTSNEALLMDLLARIEDQERWKRMQELQEKVVMLTEELARAQAENRFVHAELQALSEIWPVRMWRKLKKLGR